MIQYAQSTYSLLSLSRTSEWPGYRGGAMDHLNKLTLEEMVGFFRILINLGVTVRMVKKLANSRTIAKDVVTFWASRINHEPLQASVESEAQPAPLQQLRLDCQHVLGIVRSLVKEEERELVSQLTNLYKAGDEISFVGILKHLAPERGKPVSGEKRTPEGFKEIFLARVLNPKHNLTYRKVGQLYGFSPVWAQLWSRSFSYVRHSNAQF